MKDYIGVALAIELYIELSDCRIIHDSNEE